MTRYYRSRQSDHPVVYVQEDGQWRGYAGNGMTQRASGVIPDAILSRMVEIGADEAQTLIARWKANAPAPAQRPPQVDPAAARAAAAVVPTSVPEPVSRKVYGPDVERPERGRSKRLPFVLGGLAALVVIVIVVALAATGAFGGKHSPSSSTVTTEAGEGSVAKTDLVATVGDYAISRQKLDQKITDFAAQYPAQVPDKTTDPDRYKIFQQDVLDYLVTYRLVGVKAAELSISVTDQDVEEQMALILKVSFGGDQAKFDAAIDKQGLTMDQFKRTYKESLLFEKVFAEVTAADKVSNADIQAYYDKHKSDTYDGKSLDDVEDEVEAAALAEKQQVTWRAWISAQKDAIGVTYSNGWTAPADGSSLTP